MIFKTIKEISINNKGYYGIGASSCDFKHFRPSYLRITDISDDGNVHFPLETCIDPATYPDWQKYLLRENDLVFARTGNSTGRNYFCKNINRPTVFAGFLIKFSINPKIINPRYVGYYCQSVTYWNQIRSLFTGSTRANVNAEQYALLKIPVVDSVTQQHIVNTIGSVDDLIENLSNQNKNLFNLGLTIINRLNENNSHLSLLSICKFDKGFEVGSKQYIESAFEKGLIHYIRVGDLLTAGSTYIKPMSELSICKFDDLLVAFDGAPGRNTFGVEGAYSSGISKVVCNKENKGLIFFEINSDLNKTIIKDHSQGTTILHAGKSTQYLKYCDVCDAEKEKLNKLFYLMVLNKKKIKKLEKIKQYMLNKYF